MDDLVILYRPTGKNELALIEASDYRAFPSRLDHQPIFYPVTNEEYAIQIARDWNAKMNDDRTGYVLRFSVNRTFLDRYDKKVVGGAEHEEYWIPAEHLDEFNRHIVGKIEVIREFVAE